MTPARRSARSECWPPLTRPESSTPPTCMSQSDSASSAATTLLQSSLRPLSRCGRFAKARSASRCLARATSLRATVATPPPLPRWHGPTQWPGSRPSKRALWWRSVATGDADRPLRLVDGLLYLDRYWRQERVIAAAVDDAAGRAEPPVDEARLQAALSRLFAEPGSELQKLAAVVAAHRWISVIAGGPGTGKTTTVARVLALLQDQPGGPLRLALAAPTALAASRLEQTAAAQKAELADSDRERLRQSQSHHLAPASWVAPRLSVAVPSRPRQPAALRRRGRRRGVDGASHDDVPARRGAPSDDSAHPRRRSRPARVRRGRRCAGRSRQPRERWPAVAVIRPRPRAAADLPELSADVRDAAIRSGVVSLRQVHRFSDEIAGAREPRSRPATPVPRSMRCGDIPTSSSSSSPIRPTQPISPPSASTPSPQASIGRGCSRRTCRRRSQGPRPTPAAVRASRRPLWRRELESAGRVLAGCRDSRLWGRRTLVCRPSALGHGQRLPGSALQRRHWRRGRRRRSPAGSVPARRRDRHCCRPAGCPMSRPCMRCPFTRARAANSAPSRSCCRHPTHRC